MELFAAIILSLPSDLELKLSRKPRKQAREIDLVGVFAFKTDIEFSKDEFFLMLDSLFRGLSKLLIVKGSDRPSSKLGRVSSKELFDLVGLIYKPDEAYVTKDEFLE